jgi:all-trans-retinol 13,14-reductase
MKTEKFDVAIIGAGLGGLLCGNILAREGYKVCVIEKNPKTGGCLQIFAREKCIFNTGLNYTEGLADGQILNQYFRFFGILDQLKLKQMDADGFEVITFQGKEYRFAQGEENFIQTLAKDFPDEENNLRSYIDKLRTVCQKFPLYNLSISPDEVMNYDDLFGESLTDFLQSVTDNETLRNILAGNNLLYAGEPDKTPLYLHALITYSFISSSWRLIDGSQQMATALERNIRNCGGTIRRNCEIVRLQTENKQILYAETKDSEKIEAGFFISNIHPVNTLQMMEGKYPGRYFVNRINSLKNTTGMFTVYIVLKPGTFPYMNHNHYYYDSSSVWTIGSYNKKTWPQSFFLYTPASSRSETHADGLIVMTYMQYDELFKWENTTVENRGEDYEEFKREKAEQLISLAEKKFPGLRGCIQSYYTSTPLTYRDYTGTPEGSAYGIQKDYRYPLKTLVMPATKIPNLFFTGQNMNVHGILGVSVAAVMTCGEIVGMEYLLGKLRRF